MSFRFLNLRRGLFLALAGMVLFFSGWVLGAMLSSNKSVPVGRILAWFLSPAAGESSMDHGHEPDEEELQSVIHLSEEAFQNLQLKTGPVKRSDYLKYLQVPAEVMEKPGASDHSLAAPVNGVVTELFISPGQTVAPGDPMFRLQVTDEALTDAQIRLLDTLAKIDAVEAELARLEPLVQAGTLSGKRSLDLKYERQKLDTNRGARIQELLIRGLDEQQVERIVEQKTLVREFQIRLPRVLRPDDQNSGGEGSGRLTASNFFTAHELRSDKRDEKMEYTVEDLDAHPGMAVARGQTLCHLAFHKVLYIRGQAYESEIDDVIRVKNQRPQGPIKAEFGITGNKIIRENLSIHYIDNHVEEETQTFSFYLPLKNELIDQSVDEFGRRFQTWRFSPGQRAHVWIPVEKLKGQLKVPAEAVVWEGPEAFVFRRFNHDGHFDDDDHYDHEIEFQKTPVHVLHQDEQFALIADGGRLGPGAEIALNNAYHLNLALKLQAGGGGSHHHHEH